jgi:type II secretory pathway pseudopilin PulG
MGSPIFRNPTPAATRGRLSSLSAKEDGFTLIELTVSALIILLIAAGVAQALIGSTHFSGHQRFHAQADEVAQQDQERLKGMSDQQLSALNQTRTVTLGTSQFTVTSTAVFLDATGNSSCQSGTAAYYKLTSTASWTEGTQTPSVTEEAIVARAVTGAVLQQVKDQTGTAGLSGVTVSVDGQNSGYDTSGLTDSNGCTMITGLPTDSYAITLAAAGYVDANGNPSPPGASAAVSSNGVATPPALVLGQAGSASVTFTTAANGGRTLPISGYELSYYGLGGSHMTSFKSAGSATTPAATVSTPPSSSGGGSLFPFYSPASGYTNNYQLWAGVCEQEQPLQPLTNTGAATVQPGGAATASVDEPAIDAAFKYNGGYVTPAHVKIKFTGSGAGGNCTDTWSNVTSVGTDTVGPVNYGIYPAPFASNAAQGTPTASNTGDPGAVQVCADYQSRKEWSAATTNSNVNGPTFLATMDLKLDGASTVGTC